MGRRQGNSAALPARPLEDEAASLPRGRIAALAAVLAAAGCVAYLNSFSVPFIFDDPIYTTRNAALRHPWPPGEIVPSRPVLGLSLALNYRISGLDVWSYHALNLLIHLLAGVTLFGLARRTLAGPRLAPRFGRAATGLAFAIALLWTVHPLQTQAVTYTIQRGESLMGLFYLLTLYCAARAADSRAWPWWGAGALAAFVSGCGAKQVMATAPLMVALYYWVFYPDLLKFRRGARGWLWAGGVLISALVGLVFLRGASHASAGLGMKDVSPLAYANTQTQVLLHYLRLAVFPVDLCLDYVWPPATSLEQTWPHALAVLLLLASTVFAIVRRSPLGLLGAWFFVILAPTSSFIPLADAAVEHRMYLPLAAVVALLVTGVWLGGRRFAGRLALVAVATALVGLTLLRNHDYRSEVEIWKDTVRKRPANPRAYCNLCGALSDLGQQLGKPELCAEGAEYGRKAVQLAREIKLDYPEAHFNLGTALHHAGRPREAIEHYRTALRLREKYPDAEYNLGTALHELGRPAEAIPCYRAALAHDWSHAKAHNNLGIALFATGKYQEGVRHQREFARLEPESPDAHYNLALGLAKLGRAEEALPEYLEALRLKPGDAQTLGELRAVASALEKKLAGSAQSPATERLKSLLAQAQRELDRAGLPAKPGY